MVIATVKFFDEMRAKRNRLYVTRGDPFGRKPATNQMLVIRLVLHKEARRKLILAKVPTAT